MQALHSPELYVRLILIREGVPCSNKHISVAFCNPWSMVQFSVIEYQHHTADLTLSHWHRRHHQFHGVARLELGYVYARLYSFLSPSLTINMEPLEVPLAPEATFVRMRKDYSRSLLQLEPSQQPTWGRASRGSWMRSVGSLFLVMFAPTLVISTTVTLSAFQGSLSKFLKAVLQDGLISVVWSNWPQFSLKVTGVFTLWVMFQGILFRYLPGPTHHGQRSPAGHLLTYRTNGLNAWFVTHAFAAALCYFDFLDPAFIPKNWGSLVLSMNAAGLVLSVLAFIKAHLRPTHADDRKFSGEATAKICLNAPIMINICQDRYYTTCTWE